MQDNTGKSNLILINLPIEAVVKQLQSDDDSEDDEPLCKTVETKEQVEWKWMKKFTEEPLKECALADDCKVRIDFEIPSPFKVFNECIGFQGLFSVLKIESERYAAQNGREFEVLEKEYSAFLGINILMGIHKLPSIKSYLAVVEG